MDNQINLKAIVFDKDGTLFDYSLVWHEVIMTSIDKAFSSSNSKRVEKRKKDLIRLLGLRENGETVASGAIFSHGKFNITKKALWFCISNLMLPSSLVKYTKKIMEYNNILVEDKIKNMDFSKQRAIFKTLKEIGYKIAVVTVDNRTSANIFLKYMGIEDYVDYIATKDDNIAQKPNPESFNIFCNMFNLQPNEVAMVGDTVSDMKYAINGKAGYKIGLLWGANDYPNLKKYADVVYPDLYYLLNDSTIMKK
ncbi:MAG: HAD family hydrolase [Sphaerochaetaceae bacterium]|nr:HAD family hydrolase [Sphaerochaetaceae bacterium]MDC7238027.1 HAD family hydrolase [Sphaerochaetaceae bacterium]